mgnify:CR=1 FL=1
MGNHDKPQDLYMLIITLIALVITVILMAVRGSWLSAMPVYILGSALVLYSIWQLTPPEE